MDKENITLLPVVTLLSTFLDRVKKSANKLRYTQKSLRLSISGT
jgi:hypothetical protein